MVTKAVALGPMEKTIINNEITNIEAVVAKRDRQKSQEALDRLKQLVATYVHDAVIKQQLDQLQEKIAAL